MKVVKKEEGDLNGFHHIALVFETQEELDVITDLVGSVYGGGVVREVVDNAYNLLGGWDIDIDSVFEGSIGIKVE